ncbi:MAG: ROK family protein [Mycoplasmatales bacterium]
MILCFDIGGMSIKYGLVDENGKIYIKNKFPTPGENFEELLEHFFTIIETHINKISSISISSPGSVDSKTGIVGGTSAVPCIHGPNLKNLIYEKFKLPVSILNDANCAALAENWMGNGRGCSSLATYVIGSGIGGAFVLNGNICLGNSLYGGEFGYMLNLDANNKPVRISTKAGLWDFVKEGCEILDNNVTGEQIFDLFFDGNLQVKRLVENMILFNAVAIYNIQHTIDPEIILIGGAISQNSRFIELLKNKVKELYDSESKEGMLPNIKSCKFTNDSNLIGAAYFSIKENYENNQQ